MSCRRVILPVTLAVYLSACVEMVTMNEVMDAGPCLDPYCQPLDSDRLTLMQGLRLFAWMRTQAPTVGMLETTLSLMPASNWMWKSRAMRVRIQIWNWTLSLKRCSA